VQAARRDGQSADIRAFPLIIARIIGFGVPGIKADGFRQKAQRFRKHGYQLSNGCVFLQLGFRKPNAVKHRIACAVVQGNLDELKRPEFLDRIHKGLKVRERSDYLHLAHDAYHGDSPIP